MTDEIPARPTAAIAPEDADVARDVAEWRATLFDERKRAQAADDKLAAQLTNILIAGSVGLVIASVTFLKDIAPRPAPGSGIWLRAAWVALVVAAACGIATLATSRRSGMHYRNQLYATLKDDKVKAAQDRKLCRRWNNLSRSIRWIGLILLALSTASIVLFAQLNLPPERTANESGRFEAADTAATRAPT